MINKRAKSKGEHRPRAMDEICVFTWSSALMMFVYRMVMVWRFCGIVLYTGLIHRPRPYVACSCLFLRSKAKIKG